MRFSVLPNINSLVQQFRAIFMLLVFLTSFGRCWAEQYGLLNGSDWACCPSKVSASFTEEQVAPADHHEHSHNHDDDHDCNHEEVPKDNHPEHPSVPLPSPGDDSPCEICNLIDSGFTTLFSSIDIPEPIFELTELPWFSQWGGFQFDLFAEPAEELPPPDRRYHPCSLSTCELVTSTTVSVRGPNVK